MWYHKPEGQFLVGGQQLPIKDTPTTPLWSQEPQRNYWNSWKRGRKDYNHDMEKLLIQVDAFNFLESMIIKHGGNSVCIRKRLAMAKVTASTLLNIWKDRNITQGTKICVQKALVFLIALYKCETLSVGKADRKRLAIRKRLAMAKITASTLSNIWKDRNITQGTKICVMKALVFLIALYKCETLAVGKADRKAISTIEMWWWRGLSLGYHGEITSPIITYSPLRHRQINITNYQDWSAQA